LLSFEPSIEDFIIKAGLSRRYNFDNFAVSTTNQVAYAAAQAVVDNLGSAYNPLFLYGGVGVGKTHLAQAVGRKILENNNKKKVCFSPGDLFTNELIESIREKSTMSFRKKYRKLDLLIIDDVQFIAGKQAVQEEFFHTFNSVITFGGQIILTSDRPPTEIKNLEDRLRSRFSGGLTIDIQPPDFELRSAILLIKAREKNIDLDIEAAKIIAERIGDSRALEGTLLSIYAKIIGKQEKITPETANSFFSSEIEKKVKKISPNDVVRAVCSFYNIRQSKIKSDTRESQVVLPRQLIMYILRFHLNLKLDQVAYFLKRKDHTTVIHANDKISRMLAKDPGFKQGVDSIVSSLGLST
jgi:chromosomal replication initiator protein